MSTRKRRPRAGPAPSSGASGDLLSAARRLFARNGFDATSVRDLTSEAGVNVGAVTYHFGSKRGLYDQILVLATADFAHRVAQISTARQLPPLERLAQVIRGFFDHVRRQPEMIPLMVREMAGDGELAPPVRNLLRTVVPLIVAMIADGQKGGTIRAGQPHMLAVSTMAQPVYVNLARKGIMFATGKDPLKDDFDATVSHCVTMVRAMLEAA